MTAVMGAPATDFLSRSAVASQYFNEGGQWCGQAELPTQSLEENADRLGGEAIFSFLRFMRKMLRWEPENRQTAKQLLQDPWMKF